jgi:hypothetical protein
MASENAPQVDFIGIGDNKAATTWIMKCLAEHPDICGSQPKETHFFNRHFDEGFDWYQQHFAHCGNEQLRGEYTPGYLQWQECAERIGTHYPNTKLLVCFRKPLERIISEYHYLYSRGKTGKDIDTFIHHHDLGSLQYYRNLEQYLQFFNDDQILVLLHEDIQQDPLAFIQRIYAFLNVNSDFQPANVTDRKNITVDSMVYVHSVNRFLWGVQHYIKQLPHSRTLIRCMRLLGIQRIAQWVFKLNQRPKHLQRQIQKARPSLEVQKYVIEQCNDDIDQLAQYLKRDLSHWKTVS